MKIESLPTEIVEVVNNNNGFKMYLNNLERGRPATPRSWLYEGKSDTEVLQLWLKHLEKVKSMEYGDLVYQFDTSQLKKWGPQGHVAPIKELMDLVTAGFSRGDSSRPKIFGSKLWQEAKNVAIKQLIKDLGLWHKLRPRAPEHVVDNMRDRDTLESNSGFPDFTRRKKPEVLQKAYADIRSKRYLEFPAIALFRNYNQKTRLVWMYPMSTNIVEGQYTQPLKEAISASAQAHKFFAPWAGYEWVQLRISISYQLDRLFLSASDFSHTDEHFLKWQILEVYDVIKHAFQPQYWDGLKQSMLQVVSIPLIIGSNKWITGPHGVASGSNWTNDVETYMDYICEQYFTLLGYVTRPHTAIGDDVSHESANYDENLAEKMADKYQQMGFDVNAEKVTNKRNWIKYLQRWTHRDYFSTRKMDTDGKQYPLLRGIYSTIRALNSSLNPEKFHSPKLWSKDMFATRQFMILENCIDHPLFEEFVKFVCNGHEYLREFARLPKNKLDEIYRKSRLIPGLNPTYNQEKREKPLSSFESIRIAQNL